MCYKHTGTIVMLWWHDEYSLLAPLRCRKGECDGDEDADDVERNVMPMTTRALPVPHDNDNDDDDGDDDATMKEAQFAASVGGWGRTESSVCLREGLGPSSNMSHP